MPLIPNKPQSPQLVCNQGNHSVVKTTNNFCSVEPSEHGHFLIGVCTPTQRMCTHTTLGTGIAQLSWMCATYILTKKPMCTVEILLTGN